MGSVLSSYFGGGAPATAGEYSGDHSSITAFHSSARWQLHFNSSKQSPQLMVIDFTASWCGPCRFMEPALHAMAARFTDVQFVQIDVDQLPDVAQDFGVQAMPTFVLVKRGKEVGRVVGAMKDELERKIEKNKAVDAAAAST
uniref:Thioredoxin H2-like n=1 Tax=Rhizophora mucronata TaxID=61149 RepID=A0A2P2J8I6_RHIMU